MSLSEISTQEIAAADIEASLASDLRTLDVLSIVFTEGACQYFAVDEFTFEAAQHAISIHCDEAFFFGTEKLRLTKEGFDVAFMIADSMPAVEREYWVFMAVNAADHIDSEGRWLGPDKDFTFEEEPADIMTMHESGHAIFATDTYTRETALSKAEEVFGDHELTVLGKQWFANEHLLYDDPEELEIILHTGTHVVTEPSLPGEGREYWVVESHNEAQIADALMPNVEDGEPFEFIDSVVDVETDPLSIPFTIESRAEGATESVFTSSSFSLPFRIEHDGNAKVRFLNLFAEGEEISYPDEIEIFVDNPMVDFADVHATVCADIINGESIAGLEYTMIFTVENGKPVLLGDNPDPDIAQIHEHTKHDGSLQYQVTMHLVFYGDEEVEDFDDDSDDDGGSFGPTSHQEELAELLAQRMAMQRIGAAGSTSDNDGDSSSTEPEKTEHA